MIFEVPELSIFQERQAVLYCIEWYNTIGIARYSMIFDNTALTRCIDTVEAPHFRFYFCGCGPVLDHFNIAKFVFLFT